MIETSCTWIQSLKALNYNDAREDSNFDVVLSKVSCIRSGRISAGDAKGSAAGSCGSDAAISFVDSSHSSALPYLR